MAGTGKSTIACTIACKYHDENHLGASFFFSRGGGDVSHTDKHNNTSNSAFTAITWPNAGGTTMEGVCRCSAMAGMDVLRRFTTVGGANPNIGTGRPEPLGPHGPPRLILYGEKTVLDVQYRETSVRI